MTGQPLCFAAEDEDFCSCVYDACVPKQDHYDYQVLPESRRLVVVLIDAIGSHGNGGFVHFFWAGFDAFAVSSYWCRIGLPEAADVLMEAVALIPDYKPSSDEVHHDYSDVMVAKGDEVKRLDRQYREVRRNGKEFAKLAAYIKTHWEQFEDLTPDVDQLYRNLLATRAADATCPDDWKGKLDQLLAQSRREKEEDSGDGESMTGKTEHR